MDFSFLIVTKNRATELEFTLQKLIQLCDFSKHEILVYIDGCPTTEKIKSKFTQVKWFSNHKSISASPARNFLYKNAIGEILVGLDDDSHPVSKKPLEKMKQIFQNEPNVGIITFKEIKGVFELEESIKIDEIEETFLTNDFIGCGFAIKKEVYFKTNGFPLWIDIYGEEPCVALEVLDLGYDILYTNTIVVNHRINIEKRKLQGKNYYRFERQLRNAFRIFVIYYPWPIIKIIKLLVHNFRKYALYDLKYFVCYFKALGNMVFNLFYVLKHRKTLQKSTLSRLNNLKSLKY